MPPKYKTHRRIHGLAAVIAGLLFCSAAGAEGGPEAAARKFVEGTLRAWMADAVVVETLKAQNAGHAALTQADIDRLDKAWRAETKAADKPMINGLLGNPLSKYLAGRARASKGLVTELFVMDERGLNAGQSDLTSDYWQGDEAKWQKTYALGPGAVFIDKVDLDESTQRFQVQVSATVVDPASGAAIGAVTVGLDAEALEMQ